MFSSISWAMCVSISRANSVSRLRLLKNFPRLIASSPNRTLVEAFAHDAANGFDDLPPAARFGHQLFSACGRQLVELGFAVVLARTPVGRDPAAIFKPMQRRVK